MVSLKNEENSMFNDRIKNAGKLNRVKVTLLVIIIPLSNGGGL